MSVNILSVDDSLPMRSIIQKDIRASGFGIPNFYQASNGNEAMKILKNQWMDIVITDYNMPDMNGLELIEEMKKDDIFKTIPVLVISTEGSLQKAQEFIDKGAAGYIKKPFTPEMIKQKLTEILGEMKYDEDTENGNENLDF